MSRSSSSNGLKSTGIMKNGQIEGAKIVSSILALSSELNHYELEQSCREALKPYGDNPAIIKHDTNKVNTKKPDTRVMDMFPSGLSSTLTSAQIKNQSIRFGFEDTSNNPTKGSTWGNFSNPARGLLNVLGSTAAGSTPIESKDYEDVTAVEILQAPICDVCVIQRGDSIPDGFYRISKTLSNRKANLNTGSGGNNIYLCIKKDLRNEVQPITAIIVFFPDKGEFLPPGFIPVKRGKHACNLNSGTAAERIFFAFKRDKFGNPLTDVQVILPQKNEGIARSFCLLDKSPSGLEANLNAGTSGVKCMLTYRQRLVRLECLKNEPITDRLDILRDSKSASRFSRHHRLSTGGYSPSISVVRSSSLGDLPEKEQATPKEKSEETRQRKSGSLDEITSTNPLNGELNGEKDAQGLAKGDSLDLNRQGSEEKTGSEAGVDFDLYDEYDNTSVVNDNIFGSHFDSQIVVDSEGKIAPSESRKILHAILSSIYAHHDGLTDIALVGLLNLLKDTDFFENELKMLPHSGTVTMIDVTIDAVCDRLDTCVDTFHDKILQFLRTLIRYLSGRFSSLSLQKVYKSFSYLIGYYSTRSSWIFIPPYLPLEGGSSLTTIQVFKELIYANAAHIELVDVAQWLPLDPFYEESPMNGNESSDSSHAVVSSVVNSIVDETLESIEINRIIECVAFLVSKQNMSLMSGTFWESIRNYGRMLFSDAAYRRVFTILCSLCKSSWQNIRLAPGSDEPVAKDLGTKLLALDALLEFCRSAGEKMRMSKIMGYLIRRLVVPCLLHNVAYALSDHRVFSKILRIITALWKVWRVHLRIEFAILCEYLLTKILQASQLAIKPVFQLIVLQEVVTWFDQPSLILEMFVNYDLDNRFVSHWNVFSYLIRAVCTIARRTSTSINAWNWRQGNNTTDLQGVNFREVHICALEEVASISKTLMDATGHAFLIQQDSSFRSKSVGNGLGWEEDIDPISPRKRSSFDDGNERTPSSSPDSLRSAMGKKEEDTLQGSGRKVGQTVRSRRAAHQESEQLIQQAIAIYKEKDSIKKAVQFLVSKSFMPDTPQEIASFLRLYKSHFDPTAIGEFLGEGGVTPAEEEYWSQIRFRYIRAVSFIDLDLESALRMLLTECGFRLPGEGQKVDRMVSVFVKIFWQDNHGTIFCPFNHPDTIHVLTYAIIMLNTDLNKANKQKNRQKKMTKEQFCNNLRGADNGASIDHEYLSRIYDNIKAYPIELQYNEAEKSNLTATAAQNNLQQSSLRSPSTTNNINSPSSYDSEPSGGLGASGLMQRRAEFAKIDEKGYIKDIVRGLRDAEDLLRTLSSYTYYFQLTGIDTNLSLDLVSCMYDTVWFHFHAITDALLVDTQTGNDMTITFAALEILSHSLSSAIFLDLKVEKTIFATQLLEFRELCEPKANLLVSKRIAADENWFEDIESVNADTALETVSKLFKLVVYIKDAMQESNNYELTRQVASKIEKKAKVLENNRYFVREGELTKKNRSGSSTVYRFYLFSDHLIYAHLTMSGEYKVHEQLPLVLMSVNDVDSDMTSCSFYINHPTKSFMVIAPDHNIKAAWLHDLEEAISSCKRRESGHQATQGLNRRMSIIGRIHDQQELQIKQQETIQKVLTSTVRSPERGTPVNRLRKVSQSSGSSGNVSPLRSHALALMTAESDDHMVVPSSHSPVSKNEGNHRPNGLEINATQDEVQCVDSEGQPLIIPLTPELQESKKIDRITEFRSIVDSLDDRFITTLFEKGVDFWRGTLPARAGRGASLVKDDDIKAHLYGLYCQGTYGDCTQDHLASVLEAATAQQRAAWKACTNAEMSSVQAMRQFLQTLYEVFPYWRYDQYI